MTDVALGLGILGAGGHGRVAAEAWASAGGVVAGFYDDRGEPDRLIKASGFAFLGPFSAALHSTGMLHIAIGDNISRQRAAQSLADDRCPVVKHGSAIVAKRVGIGAGTLVCAAAVIQPDATIGRHSIVNSSALVEHDCIIGDFCHIAPGVRLAGKVKVGAGAFVGIGACIIPGIEIGQGAVVGAGAVVVSHVEPQAVVAGNPARRLR